MRTLLILVLLAIAFATADVQLTAAQVCVGCPVKKLKTTRIRDGRWHSDIALGRGVTVQDAELIVRSARRDMISDAKPSEWRAIETEKVTQVNASEWIVVVASAPWSVVPDAGARYFDVIERSGRINVVGLKDGRLERVASITIDP